MKIENSMKTENSKHLKADLIEKPRDIIDQGIKQFVCTRMYG